MSHAIQGHPRRMRHSGEFQSVVHWRREWQTTPVFLPREPHEHEQCVMTSGKFQTLSDIKNYIVLNTLHDWLKSNVLVGMKVICKWQIPMECKISLLYKLSWCLKIMLLSQEYGRLGKCWNPVSHRKEQSLKGAWTQPFILVEDFKAQVGWLVQGHIANELQDQKQPSGNWVPVQNATPFSFNFIPCAPS